jgi:hypothetical protein
MPNILRGPRLALRRGVPDGTWRDGLLMDLLVDEFRDHPGEGGGHR